MAVCWSIYKHYFSAPGNGYAYNLYDLAAFHNLYTNYMNSLTIHLSKSSFFNLNYDYFTENQEEVTNQLLEFVGLEFQEACVNFHKTERTVRTASNSQVRQKLYKNSSKEWQKYEFGIKELKSLLN
jgi:hypothetical protein